MIRRIMAVGLALFLVTAAGCSPRESKQEKPVPGGTLTMALLRAPTGVFRPLVSADRDSAVITGLMYSGLLRTGPHWELVCDLCEQYTVSADQRTVTFALRQDVQWHDGHPFTAADVAFTYRALLTPDYTGPQAGRLTALAGVQALLDDRDSVDRQAAAGALGPAEALAKKTAAWKSWLDGAGKRAVNVVDDHTIAFGMDQPYAPLLTAMLLPIAPAHTTQPVGTGPYKLVEFKKGQYVKLTRNETYHLGRPYIETVIARVVEPAKVPGMLQDGALDYAPVAAADLDGFPAGGPVRVLEWPAAGYQYLGVNHDLPVFSDVRVRQALLYGINRKALVDQLLHGHGVAVNTHMAADHWAVDAAALNAYPHDAGRAATLLAEAGWSELSADGYRLRNGKRLEFTLKYPAGNPVREASAVMIQSDLRAVGVKVNLEKQDFYQLVREVFGGRQAEAWLLGWDLGADPDPGPIFSPDNKWGNASGWGNARGQELLRQGAGTLTEEERKPIYTEWAKLINAELPYLPLYGETELAAVRSDRVRGVQPDVRGALWNIWAWWIPKEKQG